MDDIDQAQGFEQMRRDIALHQVLSNSETRQNRVGELVYCLDCDAEIPEERLEARPHACRCIECQELHEKGIT